MPGPVQLRTPDRFISNGWTPSAKRSFAAGLKFVDKVRADGKPFFLYVNPSRMHVITHLSPKYEAMRNSKNGWPIQEAGMAQLGDSIGAIMPYLKDNGLDDNTIVMFTTDNGPET